MSIFGTNNIMQVAVVVKDIEVTKRKYAEFLGVEPPPTRGTGDYAVTQTTYKGQPAPKVACKMAFFDIGPGLQLELIEPNGEKSAWQDYLDEHGEGVHHLAFGVKNTDEKIAVAEKFGFPLIQRGTYGDGSGEYAYFESYKDLKLLVETLESY